MATMLAAAPHNAMAAGESAAPSCDATGWRSFAADPSASTSGEFIKAGRKWKVLLKRIEPQQALAYLQLTLTDANGANHTVKSSFDPDSAYCTATNGHLLVKRNAMDVKGIVEFSDEGVLRVFPYGQTVTNFAPNWDWFFGDQSSQGLTASKDAAGNTVINSSTGNGMRFILTKQQKATITWDSSSFKIAPDSGGASADFTMVFGNEKSIIMDANGGAWNSGATTSRQTIDTTYKPVTENRPTRQGWQIKSWNTKPDGTGDDVSVKGASLVDGQTVYAQWEKDAGNPSSVDIECATRKDGGVLCSIVARYADAPMRTRELTAAGSNALAWSGDGGITGVKLDDTGYAGDVSCVPSRSGGDAQCYYASLAEAPTVTPTGYVAQMSQTGDPAANVRQQAVYVIALLAVGMAAAVAVAGREKSV